MADAANALKKVLRRGLRSARDLRRKLLPHRVFLLDTDAEQADPATQDRLNFFMSVTDCRAEILSGPSLKPVLFHGPVFVRGIAKQEMPLAVRLMNLVLDVDEKRCPTEAWNWHVGLEFLTGPADRRKAYRIFSEWKARLPAALGRSYLFGTGPSLARAVDRDWSDGYRVVCNTIVRDPELWHHVDPHAVVAGDALYHFGIAEFAVAFRLDLKQRLRESPKTIFVYPAIFDNFVRKEMAEFEGRLVPIGKSALPTIHISLLENFGLPEVGNVLNLLLLPIGCTLSRKLGLWGFDGRAPKDQLFWTNSNKHTYSELMATLTRTSPAFFDEMVPKEDPEKYLRSVHGDSLAWRLSEAEKDGFSFEMLHKSWTPVLATYYRAENEGRKD